LERRRRPALSRIDAATGARVEKEDRGEKKGREEVPRKIGRRELFYAAAAAALS